LTTSQLGTDLIYIGAGQKQTELDNQRLAYQRALKPRFMMLTIMIKEAAAAASRSNVLGCCVA